MGVHKSLLEWLNIKITYIVYIFTYFNEKSHKYYTPRATKKCWEQKKTIIGRLSNINIKYFTSHRIFGR